MEGILSDIHCLCEVLPMYVTVLYKDDIQTNPLARKHRIRYLVLSSLLVYISLCLLDCQHAVRFDFR